MSAQPVSAWDDPTLTGALGDRLADDLRRMVREYDADAARNKQTDLGPSEIGDPCTHCLAEKILGLHTRSTSAHEDGWRAIVGTAVHDWLDSAAAASNVRHDRARWYPECRVQPDTRLLPVGGKCDLYDADTRTVIDHKTTSRPKLATYRLSGPGIAYRRQAHLYGLGYANAGHDVEHVALAFWLRDGTIRDLFVWTEPFDAQIARDTLARYDALRGLCATGGPAVLGSLPSDPGCYECNRRQEPTSALASTPAQTNPA